MKRITQFAVIFLIGIYSYSLSALSLLPVFPFSTRENKIVDKRGKEFFWHGVNISGMEWGAGTAAGKKCNNLKWGCYHLPAPGVYDQLATWGFNIVRVPVSWANIEPSSGKPYNSAYLQAVDHIIAECAKRHIAVILSMQQWAWSPVINIVKKKSQRLAHGNGFPVWLYDENWFATDPVTGHTRTKPLTHFSDGQDAASREFFVNKRVIESKKIQDKFIDVWIMLAQRYRNNANVIGADIINEPYGNSETQLEELYLHAGIAIHKANPNLLILVEPSISKADFNAKVFLKNAEFPRRQAVYSIHVYPKQWERNATKKIRSSLLGKPIVDRALRVAELWQVPLFIGEFQLPPQAQSMLSYFYKNENGKMNIYWTYWSYQRNKHALLNSAGKFNRDVVDVLVKGGK